MVQYGFRLFVEVLAQLTSVERILQYTRLPKEQPLTSLVQLPERWPRRGRIELRNVSMRYEDGQPFVLKVSQLQLRSCPGYGYFLLPNLHVMFLLKKKMKKNEKKMKNVLRSNNIDFHGQMLK